MSCVYKLTMSSDLQIREIWLDFNQAAKLLTPWFSVVSHLLSVFSLLSLSGFFPSYQFHPAASMLL